jgi:hypothetical protein
VSHPTGSGARSAADSRRRWPRPDLDVPGLAERIGLFDPLVALDVLEVLAHGLANGLDRRGFGIWPGLWVRRRCKEHGGVVGAVLNYFDDPEETAF